MHCYIVSMHLSVLILFAIFVGPAVATNFVTCVLDKLPGTANDVAAQAVYQLCLSHTLGRAPLQRSSTGTPSLTT